MIINESLDVKRNRKYQQRIAEQYWNEKRRCENGLSKFSSIRMNQVTRFHILVNEQPYICRQCKCRGTEADYIESTLL